MSGEGGELDWSETIRGGKKWPNSIYVLNMSVGERVQSSITTGFYSK